jgi:FAD/FMN-containing dehydrogenase
MNIVELPVRPMSPELIAHFTAIVGDRYAVTAPSEIAPYLTEERGLYHGRSPLVLRPGNVAEVAAVLKLANETKTPIVPQGGNTGLVGGQTPHQGEVLMSLRRLDRIREVDPTSNTMTCEAGVVLIKAQEAAAASGRPMPAARARSPMGLRASSCSGSRWCSLTAASSTICAS